MPARKRKTTTRRSSGPANRVVFAGTAIEDLEQVPATLRPRVRRALDDLATNGCKAADYALSGDPPWPHLCSLHVAALRIIVAFPEHGVVAVVKIAPHDPASDPYAEIADDLGISVSTARRTKPPCCDETGVPRVDARIVDDLEASMQALSRRERRQRSRRAQRR
jgi:mRNA-degrading endonuclease RelE of RelBE toxin-antitoxin system